MRALAVFVPLLVVALAAPHAPPSPGEGRLLPLVSYVDPFIGTLGDGNTFPGATLPFGMVQWSPDTSAGGLTKPGGYNGGDGIVTGFSLTHLSGAGCVAMGNFPFMPTIRRVLRAPLPNGSPYSAHLDHRRERAAPGYYAVQLGNGVAVQLTVTQRTGFGIFRFPASRQSSLLVGAGAGAGARTNMDGAEDARISLPARGGLVGWARSGGFCGLHNHYTIYFAAQFNRPFLAFGTWSAGRLHPGSRQAAGSRSGAFVSFDTRSNRTVMVKVGLSYVSSHDALLNLQRENAGWNFTATRREASAVWNAALNRVQVHGGQPAQRQVFYSALYHALLHPNVFSDVNGAYVGFDGKRHVARGYTQYANFSGWDIYRTQIPLLALVSPLQTGDMMQSLVADAEQGGWLPKWPLANAYTGEMDGDSADPILAEAYALGARHFDARRALQLMLKGANQTGYGPGGYQERPDLALYLRHGYVPVISGHYGGASVTLEYALDDFAIDRLAATLADRHDAAVFTQRAGNWHHLFDTRRGFIVPRLVDGARPARFDPASPDGFVEGNAWQYTWMEPQDLGGLVHAFDGADCMVARLNRFFVALNAPTTLGQRVPHYWAGNEPGLEAPWEYDFLGRPAQTEEVVRRIRALYTPARDGLPGNDDLGTLSAWYVWASLGLYPEIPGEAGFALDTPAFPDIDLSLAGHRVRLVAAGRAGDNYVQSVNRNGRSYGSSWMPLSLLQNGAVVRFSLGSRAGRWAVRLGEGWPSLTH